ncbi:MAG TPA: hypothetical protein VMF56_11080 [Acidobacteriaceae bacterium]|nr:hypothetical protein [Acidobacteriaceae bacterium]
MTPQTDASPTSASPEMTDFLSSRPGSRLHPVWIALVLLPVACSLYLGLHRLRGSWDDGAITAAYARTFADSGRIALTPASPQVEGVSSLTWFLLLTIPRFFSSNPDNILIWMKCASAISLVLALAVFFRVARDQLDGSETCALACTLMLAFSYTSLLEIDNGMEMNLAVLLTVLLFYLLTRAPAGPSHLVLGWIVATVLLATRFESPLLLSMLAIGLYFDGDERRNRPSHRALFVLAACTLASFGLLEIWRHHELGIWMPNTVYAKEWPPYSRWHGKKSLIVWVATCISTVEIIFTMISIPFLLMLAVVANRLRRKHADFASLRRVGNAVWTLTACAFVIAWITGKDWGYPGRMVGPFLPFLLIAIVAVCKSALANRTHLTLLLRGMVASQIILWLIVAAYGSKPSVSVEQARQIGIGADAIRTALHEPTLVVLLPDVGGSSLYNENLRILDSALLSNPQLAKRGWRDFAEYFHTVRPDVFETHSLWANYQGAYTSDLLKDYSIVGADGKRYFVRNDLFAQLLANKDGKIVPVESSSSCLGGPLPADVAFSRSRKTCLVLFPDASATD